MRVGGALTLHGAQINYGESAQEVVVAARAAFSHPLESVQLDCLSAQKCPGTGHVFGALRPAKAEHLGRLLDIALLLDAAVRDTLRSGGELRPARRDGCLSLFNLLPGFSDFSPNAVGRRESMLGAVIRKGLGGSAHVDGCRAAQQVVYLAGKPLILDEQLKVLDTVLIYVISGIHRAEKRELLGVVPAQADIAAHGGEAGVGCQRYCECATGELIYTVC